MRIRLLLLLSLIVASSVSASAQIVPVVHAQVTGLQVRLTCTASTSAGVTGYNVYRKTATTNVSKINATPASSCAYTDAAVTQGSTYDYTMRAIGSDGTESADSNVATATIPTSPPPPPPPPGCITSTQGAFRGSTFTAQTGSFVIEFDVTPSSQTMDAIVGLSNGTPTSYNSFGPIVRLLSSRFEFRNGGAYVTSPVAFVAGVTYHVKLVVTVSTRKYDVFIGTTQIATAAAFRTEQAAVTRLTNWATTSEQGALQVCNVTTSIPPPPPPPPATLSQTCTRSGMRITCVSDFANMPALASFKSVVTMSDKTDTDTLVGP